MVSAKCRRLRITTLPLWCKRMAPDPFSPLFDLCWHTVRVELRNTRNVYARQHPLAVFAAVFKEAARASGAVGLSDFFYHPLAGPVGDRVLKNMVYPLELVFAKSSPQQINSFVKALAVHLQDRRNNFSIVRTEPARSRNLAELLKEQPLTGQDEICLDFITPFPFTPRERTRRHLIDRDVFFRKLLFRITELFPVRLKVDAATWSGVRLLPCYWEYYERSRTPGGKGKQLLNGTIGPLYLKGDIAAVYPLLLICSELNAGRRKAFGLGRYLLRNEQPFFDNRLADRQFFIHCRQELDLHSDYREAIAGELLQPDRTIGELHRSLLDGEYVPAPATTADIPKKGGTLRTIALLAPRDHLVHYFLLKILQPVLDRMFEDSAVGYRPRRSRQTARKMIIEAYREGFSYALKTDIASFFDQIDWAILSAKLHACLPEADRQTTALLKQCITTGLQGPDGRLERNKGLLQGSPLSPLLANLYLDSFDENMAGLGYRLIRYGDDCIIMVRGREEGEAALNDIKALLEPLKLTLQEEKTSLQPLDMGFTFLGLEFGAMIDEEFVERTALKKTLFIQEQYGFLGIDGCSVVIKKGGALLSRLPLHRISGIVIFGSSTLSTKLLQTCSRRHIPVSFCSPAGYYVSTLKPDSRRFFKISADHAARHQSLSPEDNVRLAAEIVTAKVENYLVWLQERREPELKRLCGKLDQGLAALQRCQSVEQVRGHEGAAGRLIFSAVNSLAGNAYFHVDNRICHQRADPYNSLLDFASFLLFCKLNVLVRTRGLNPYLGILHSAKDSYESLVSDLQEMFRYRMDRMVIRMINLRIIRETDFEEAPEGGKKLNREAAGRFLNYFARELALRLAAEPGTLKQLLVAQAGVVERWASGDDNLIFFNLRSAMPVNRKT